MITSIIPKTKTLQALSEYDWLIDLECLLARHSGLCCLEDVSSFTIDELKGLHNWLSSLS